MKTTVFFMLMVLCVCCAYSQNCSHDNSNFRCVKYVKNYDGDTITVDIPGVHPLLGSSIGVRVNGVDTPEIKTKNACEKEKAFIAKELVRSVLSGAKQIDLLNVSRGKYFRVVADVVADGVSVSEKLLALGLAYKYDGGTKLDINWCK